MEYYSKANSFLNEVIVDREGLPISYFCSSDCVEANWTWHLEYGKLFASKNTNKQKEEKQSSSSKSGGRKKGKSSWMDDAKKSAAADRKRGQCRSPKGEGDRRWASGSPPKARARRAQPQRRRRRGRAAPAALAWASGARAHAARAPRTVGTGR